MTNPRTNRMANHGNGRSREPIAIVGMACRFPGAPNIRAFWRLLEEGGNSVQEGVPGAGGGRWSQIFGDDPVRSEGCRFGAFVDDIDQFDEAFFRISPVEAELLDPQQRMMLETSWEALEDAGIDPEGLRETLTGVYTGISNDEYRMLVVDSTKPADAASCLYALSGTNLNGTSGRVSFVLGLRGPAKAVDAACASAMVSVHDAVADLQQGRADLAIAGGVQAILNGRIYELRADAMMLSPDGQCKTFDASANGYVRGEGCGVVVLKRLREAEADGDRIWAVIRGSAVNHGGAGTGLTVPHTPALEEVMHTALADAGVSPLEVDYLEAHGTGTTVGDPIEADAVAAVYGTGRDAERPLLMGSVKTNIGHLESAAGVAGVIKAALVLHRGVIPKHLHFHDPNPEIDWDRLPLRVTSSMMEWPDLPGRRRRAGVNSFGISGTNAHLVMEEYRAADGASADGDRVDGDRVAGAERPVAVSMPETVADLPVPEGVEPRRARLLPLSGKSAGALRDLAARYVSWLDEHSGETSANGSAPPALPPGLLSDMAWTAGVGRSHFDHRAGVVFDDAVSLRAALVAMGAVPDGAGGEEPGASRGATPCRAPGRVAFAYTGQGSQWSGMGRALYETEPVARAVLDRCEAVFARERGASLLDVMFGRPDGAGDLGDTAWEQPALYALECALTALWASLGVRPDVVIGHSIGELAASQAAGVFSLEDGMRFAAARGALMSRMEEGGMAAVFAPPDRVAAAVEAANAAMSEAVSGVGLSISGYNGGHQVVSGPVAGIEAISARFEEEGVRVRRLNTRRAFHSALVDPILDELAASLDDVVITAPALTVVSNLTGRAVEPGQALDGAYWRRHAREPVAFAQGVEALAELGVDLVLEIGPRSLLAPMAASAWPESAQAPAPGLLSSLRPPPADAAGSGEAASGEPRPASPDGFAEAVAEAYEAGLSLRFEGLFAGEARRRISLPSYPFQRVRRWLAAPRRRHGGAGHPLLGARHESAGGEITFETDVFPSDPSWMDDHRVFGRVVAPGALYGAMTIAASLLEEGGSVVVEDMQLHNPLVFDDEGDADDGDADATEAAGRTLQVVLDAPDPTTPRGVRLFSRGREGVWTVHVEGRLAAGVPDPDDGGRVDLERLRADLSPVEVADYYRHRASTGVDLGPSFRTLGRAWSGPGEAVAEVSLPDAFAGHAFDAHPLVLDGCFQAVGVARNVAGTEGGATYLPFGWERLWLAGRLPDRVVCHVRLSDASRDADLAGAAAGGEPPEVLSGELTIYDPNGALLGRLSGYTVKRATRQALLSAVEGIKDLLYEVVWRERELAKGIDPADFFPSPAAVAEGAQLFAGYLTDAGVDPDNRNELLADLERWSHARALQTLEDLGWRRTVGETVDPDQLREELGVLPEHGRLFRRMFEMLAWSGGAEETADGFLVLVGPDDPLPEQLPRDLDAFADEMTGLYAHGLTEVGLFRRSGLALADVLRGGADPLTLLFSSGSPTAADLYLKAPVARAANEMLAEAVRALVAALPEGRRLRVIEVGAGTGSATASVLPELPEGRFDYVYTDISAGFFAEAEARFGDGGGSIEYRPLDIEKDPLAQGFDAHSYDLMIASNVLHATRYLEETLGHCRDLMAPSGQLVALENLTGLGWMDLTFGQLDGWWRFADDYRPHHALAGPGVWRQALGDAGFEAVEVLGVDESDPDMKLDKGVIVAQGPARVTEPAGAWVFAADDGGVAERLAAEMRARNQTVVVSDGTGGANGTDAADRDAWRALIERLPEDVPFHGVAHFAALDGHGEGAVTDEMAADVKRSVASALALVQGVADSDLTPERGVWLVTRGAQILERERGGELAGAAVWGFGKGVAREAAHLQPRMLDLDPVSMAAVPDLANELLYPDPESHIAYRRGSRQVARLVRMGAGVERLEFPEETEWVLAPDTAGVFDRPHVQALPARALEPREVRVAVEAAGLNFWDVFRSLGFIEEGLLGREMCGHILEVGAEVSNVAVGDHIVGLGFGAFGPQMITHEELVAPAPDGVSVSGLATVPSAYVSAALSFELSGLEAGERVLVHAGAGGVGLAAIQLVQAAGAEVFATASAPKQAYLRSLGVEHVFDSRTTAFGAEILEATDGEGVDVVLNSLTSEGFIDASLDCLREGGRFVEMARRDILTEEEMAAARPDVGYWILELDVLKKTDPAWVGRVLRGVMTQLSTGEIEPIVHSRWPLAEAGAALSFMRSARHLGKIVVTTPPLVRGGLRPDRSYLVTGGLGGIGVAVAGWLADRGAGAIVLNGRRDPDPEAEAAIEALRARGARVEVVLADMTDQAAIDGMMARIERDLPPLGGVIHSVGVLSDGALTNQNWERFERVLWPKILGAWHLHRATMDLDLDFFTLFTSRVGVMGNPGQANHAAANAFLDQLAGHRRALGLPGQAIAWGAWSEIGEAAEQRDRIDRQRSALGGRWFTPQQGLRAFDRLVRQDATTSVVMSMDWDVFEEAVEEPPLMLEDLLSAAAEAKAGDVSAEDILTQLGSTAAAEREDLLVSFVQGEVQAVLRLSSAPAPTVGFFDLGMDSLMAVELRNRLNRTFAGTYTAPTTLVFDYPNIAELAAHLAAEVGDVAAGAGSSAAAPTRSVAGSAPAAAAPGPTAGAVSARPADGEADEGVAIIGMACRFPGAPDLAAFWHQLDTGVDAVTDGRRDAGPWNGVAGDPASSDPYSRCGAFLEGIDTFDARFFGIRPIEARMMDPRQRLLLETTWHALEDAGVDPAQLKGTNTGVYAGVTTGDYRDLAAAMGEGHGYLGTTMSVTAGRISFALGLTGPAVPLDMACASSLVAVHQAASALRQGEMELALVGGVNAILWPETATFMKDVGMLSASGRCHSFDAAADGFVRGEGCGMVVLKRLSAARADGDRVWGVIRGSAVNQNGTSAGLTVPNGPAQERVIEDALARAGLPPAEVDFLEAHGAGSDLGDPIEVQAAAAVYGRGREEGRPLLIGSVKTNIGHLECAAGIASLIKAVLAMNGGRIPKQLHFHDPNPHLAWDELPVRVVAEPTAWPSNGDRPPRAGVSSFGIAGTNAHVVVEGNGGVEDASIMNGAPMPAGAAVAVPVALPEAEGWPPLATDIAPRETRLLPLSAKSPEALRALAERYVEWLDGHDPVPLADMAWTAGVGRSHLAHRAGVVFRDAASLRDALRDVAGRAADEDRRWDAEAATSPRVAFMYADEEGAHEGMGREMYDAEPVVRAVLDRCDAVLAEARDGASLLDVMFGRAGADGTLRDPEWAQPAVYALACALTALWASVGVPPGAVAGDGVGELAAAWAAGVFSLDDGLRLAAARGTAMARPKQRLAAAMPAAGADAAASDPLDDIVAASAGIATAPPSVAFVSQVSGRRMDAVHAPDAAYWREQASARRNPDRTAAALSDLGVDVVLEIGPDAPTFAASVARAYEAGVPVSFAGLFAGEARRRIPLPGYPFQRRRHWIATGA